MFDPQREKNRRIGVPPGNDPSAHSGHDADAAGFAEMIDSTSTGRSGPGAISKPGWNDKCKNPVEEAAARIAGELLPRQQPCCAFHTSAAHDHDQHRTRAFQHRRAVYQPSRNDHVEILAERRKPSRAFDSAIVYGSHQKLVASLIS